MVGSLPLATDLADNAAMNLLDNLRLHWRTVGAPKTVFFVLQRTIRRLTFETIAPYIFHLLVQPVHAAPLLPEHLRAGVTIRSIALGEANEVTFLRSLSELKARLEGGDICLAAYRGDEFVGYFWLHFGPFVDEVSRCRFVPTPTDRVAWDHDLYILSHERGGIVLAALWDAANEVLRSRGYDWTESFVSALNGPSLRTHERLGARRLGTVFFMRVGALQITLSSLPSHVHVSLNSARMPTIVVVVPELEEEPAVGGGRPQPDGTMRRPNVGG